AGNWPNNSKRSVQRPKCCSCPVTPTMRSRITACSNPAWRCWKNHSPPHGCPTKSAKSSTPPALPVDPSDPRQLFLHKELMFRQELLRVVEAAGSDINVLCSLHRLVGQLRPARRAKRPPRLRCSPVTL